MKNISVVISVVEEEVSTLPRALASVKNLASEIVIVDMTGSNKLFEIAKKYHAKVYKHERVSYVEIVRNFGISKAEGEWILIMDPDEEVSKTLSDKITSIVDYNEADYYRLPRKNIIFGKWIKHSRWWPDYNIRFFKKGKVIWNEAIHSVPLTKGVGSDLKPSEENAITHYHYQTVEQYIQRMNRYTSAQTKGLVGDGYKFHWKDLIQKPAAEFLSRFFQGEGYKDGLHGLALAGLQAVSEFVVYLKVWQEKKFKDVSLDLDETIKVMKNVESDIHFWQADSLLKENGGISQRIKRKFRL